MNPIDVLKKWLVKLHDDFGDTMPDPSKADAIINVVPQYFNTSLINYLGAGDNGVAFKTADGDVVKYTIDKNEAMLWHRLKNMDMKGIAKLKDVVRLKSSKTGETHLFVVRVEFVAHDISPEQGKMVRIALNKGKEPDGRTGLSREQYVANRSVKLMSAFDELAEADPDFEYIPDMIADLADKHNAHVYDLQPDNFKKNKEGKIVLIDPSVPDLIGDVDHPQDFLFEDKVNMALECKDVYV